MSEEFVLRTAVVRAFVEDVQATIAAASSPEQACDALRPRFAELLADRHWLPAEYQAAAPGSGMGGAIGQWLLYRALGWEPPQFMHCELVTDDAGNRLAKRHAALSLRELRANGLAPASIRASPAFQRTSPFPKRHGPATGL